MSVVDEMVTVILFSIVLVNSSIISQTTFEILGVCRGGRSIYIEIKLLQ